MRRWLTAGWLAGLALASAASWLIWNRTAITDADLRFAASLAPMVAWALLPVLFWQAFTRRNEGPELPNLRDQRRAARALLAGRGLRSRHARYSVPFYLVTGPAGAGKSSLLERSDLALGEPAAIGNATWWVGEDAVFVEAACGGAETGIREVAELIRSLRPQLPLNGVVLVVSPADLTLADKAEQKAQSAAAAQALRDLEEVADGPVPVYMLLAKVDLVPGFREFFDRQEPQERLQPRGFTLPFSGLGSGSASEKEEAITAGFLDMLAAMRMRHIEWLSREADPVRCGRIQGFGAQVAGLQQTIRPVLEAILPGQTRAWNGAALRGVFLTSARQEPLSIDALLPELSRRFAMPRIGTAPPDLGLDEEEHGYFVNGTFKSAIFPEAGLVAREMRSGIGGFAQWAAIAAIVAICAGAAYFVFQAFDAETRLVARISELSAEGPELATPSTIEALPAVVAELKRLKALRTEIDAGAPAESLAWLSGSSRLKPGMDIELREFRANALAPHLSAMLETQMVDMEADPERLAALIDLSGKTGDADSAAFRGWLEDSTGSLPEADRQLLVAEGIAAAREKGGLSIDPAYVEAARRIIASKENLS